MGYWSDVLGLSSEPSSSSIFESHTGGPTKPASDGLFSSLFSGPSESRAPEEVPFGGYGEPDMPLASQATGYGGQRFGSYAEADMSRLIDGVVTDPDTGYTGTPRQIYKRYIAEGRDPRRLVQRYHR